MRHAKPVLIGFEDCKTFQTALTQPNSDRTRTGASI